MSGLHVVGWSTVLASIVAVTVATTPAMAAEPPPPVSPPAATAQPSQAAPVEQGSTSATTTPSCTPGADPTTRVCVASAPQDLQSSATGSAVSPPLYCGEHEDGRFWATRLEGCRTTGLVLSTYRIVDGVTTTTGEVDMNVLSYLYGDPTLPTTAFQINVLPYKGWGDALKASVSGAPSAVSGCKFGTGSFPAQPVSPFNLKFRTGNSYYDTTATTKGAIAVCTAKWSLNFVTPGYPDAAASYTEGVFRCDNATAGQTKVGCVIPWAAEWLVYYSSITRELASHVTRAQASGLPGKPGGVPLHRTTVQATINTNRNRACYQTPATAGKTCDEYPIATSREGLASLSATAWQSKRRTFSGCTFALPAQTGPVGASACMILAGDQSSQGGTNTQFFRKWRVLDGDPFFVSVQ